MEICLTLFAVNFIKTQDFKAQDRGFFIKSKILILLISYLNL